MPVEPLRPAAARAGHRGPRRCGAAAVVVVAAAFAAALAPAVGRAQVPVAPHVCRHHAVVCQSPAAAHAGEAILERGGNAVDAAVATAFALAVAFPEAGNIGGGGFLVLCRPAAGGDPPLLTTVDFREIAPARAGPRMFLDEHGEYDAKRHHHGHVAVGVPGTVAGLGLAHRRYGRLPWREVLAPAIELARSGFAVSAALAAALAEVAPELTPQPVAAAPFRRGDRPLEAGETLVQRDLAATLKRIAADGPEEFYHGRTARLLVEEMERGHGLITLADLAAYRAIERPPVTGAYRDFRVVAMGPPSSGGIVLIEMLGILQGFDLSGPGALDAASIHLMAESMRRGFADRARFLADPDQVDVPVERLTSAAHAAELRRSIDPEHASVSDPARFTWPAESEETTHISVVDGDGMAVALTTTLEYSYGSRIVVPGAGFILNNEMGDFNAGPGLTTREGFIGTDPNLAAPHKRMLSSMCPTILLRDGEVRAVLGSPGGRTIINTVLDVIVYLVDRGARIQEAVDAPRIHHQWLPDILRVERGISPDTVRLLEGRGHRVEVRAGPQGSVMAIARDPASGALEIGCDRRRPDGAWAGR